MAKAYNCGCPGKYPCPKIKGIAAEQAIHEDGLTVLAKNVKGKNYLGAGIYIAEYKHNMHFRNDATLDGNSPVDCIALRKPAQNVTCDGYHLTQALAQEVIAEILDLLAKTPAKKYFTMYNHDAGAIQPTEFWNRAGITDVANRLSDALADWPS